MKKYLQTLVIFITNSIFCHSQNTIFIQPLGDVNKDYLLQVKKSIKNFYGYECIVKNKVDFTTDILAASKTRYEASKILTKYNSNNWTLILTEKDIATSKNQYPEWGIFGLGRMPGKVCVVSTHRLVVKGNYTKTIDRLVKVSLHEVGHNLGLNHCVYDKKCLMNDANGTIKQVDKEKIWICSKCKSHIL